MAVAVLAAVVGTSIWLAIWLEEKLGPVGRPPAAMPRHRPSLRCHSTPPVRRWAASSSA